MHIDDNTFKRNNKTYRRVLIRESYREGKKVKSRTIANISHLSNLEIEAMKIAFKYKNDLAFLEAFAEQNIKYDKIIGPCFLVFQVIKKLGIDKFLPDGPMTPYILWLIMVRLIDQGSRLSAVRMANHHYGCEWLNIDTINENYLYEALCWLSDHQSQLESNIFRSWKKNNPDQAPRLFLYDVSSSYLEGVQNELGAFGYNRDKKKGKMQIVYGLLTDQGGYPLAIEAFKGNTVDTATMDAQLTRIKELYGCKTVTLVGDKGMIKHLQIEQIKAHNYHYITSISKPQIKALINKGVFQLELFADQLCEIEDSQEGIRYFLRRNPERAEQIRISREGKLSKLNTKLEKANQYLKEHPRAKVEVQVRLLQEAINKLKLKDVVTFEQIEGQSRKLSLNINQDKMDELAQLDGCYVIKTDLKKEQADKNVVHKQYKNLSLVEFGFRTNKTCLEIRPIYLRKEANTKGHLIVCMLAYMIERYLRDLFSEFNVTVQEALNSLSKITSVKTVINNTEIIRILEPDDFSQMLLNKAEIKLPKSIAASKLNVVTYKKIQTERK